VLIKFLKEWAGRSVKRVTTTSDDDPEADDILETNLMVKVEPGGLDEAFGRDLEELLDKFRSGFFLRVDSQN